MDAGRIRTTLLAGVQGSALVLIILGGTPILLALSLVSIVLVPLGIGGFTTPLVLTLVRSHANFRRWLAEEWAGMRVPVSYKPFPDDVRPGIVGVFERCSIMLKDGATWRDMRWLVVDMTAGLITALLTPAALVYGIHGVLLVCGLWQPLADGTGTNWYTFVPVTGWGTAILAALVGAAILAVTHALGGNLVRLHFAVSRALLQPPRAMRLHQRIDELTETRQDLIDASAGELRRIERDLHDGAQARLVAMGMSFGLIESLVDRDPQQAKALLVEAREHSAEALNELRDLVRGIRPPVLAERGLPDAVRALALRMPMTVTVNIDYPGRAAESIEEAVYFAVSEVLTNAAKYSNAERTDISLSHRADVLTVVVSDNGKGGAVPGAGSGLIGVEKRLAAFDGTMTLSSPDGGPTVVTMTLPCRLRP
ncbi:sensor histidine kinase [Actinoplanes subglobosus]|uniref:histidine kinase n=1 Tax=Actinoplanes subglobosus TaxID=1547892 RepID=A0ABV8J365_9ACTN